MHILSRYIGKVILSTTLLTAFLVVSIDMLFLIVNELRAVGEGDYTFLKAIQYILFTAPGRLYFIFPMASLIGALLGLGLLAGHSELIVMRSAGVSIMQISGAVLRAALLLVLFITLIGEFVVPNATRYAEIFRETSITGDQTVTTPQGTWIRSGENFIRVKQILPNGNLEGIIRYEFDENNQLKNTAYAQHAEYDNSSQLWKVYNIKQTNLDQQPVTVEDISEQAWNLALQPRLLNVLVEQPDSLSLVGLYNYINYLQDNHLRAQEYTLTFWKKIWQPLATLVMVFIAIPVIFGPLRSATMGLRLLIGVLLGFTFYILNQLFGPLSLVYSPFPPAIAAVLPSFIFAIGAIVLFKRTR